jgi:hypothetical protein
VETVDAFYADRARSESREVRLGTNWRNLNRPGFVYSVFWLEATKELCAMRAPVRDVYVSGGNENFFDPFPIHAEVSRLPDALVTVEVLGTFNLEDVQRLLSGWEDHVVEEDGFRWIEAQLQPA